MGYSEIASWCGLPPYWRPWGDFVDRRFLERGFAINQIYFFFSKNLRNLHSTQEAGKWWAFSYEILIILFFIAKSSSKFYRFFNPSLAFCGLLAHVKKIASLLFVSFFNLLMICLVSFRFCCVSFRFVSFRFCFVFILFHCCCVSFRFVSFLLVSFRFVSVSFLVLQSPQRLVSFIIIDERQYTEITSHLIT